MRSLFTLSTILFCVHLGDQALAQDPEGLQDSLIAICGTGHVSGPGTIETSVSVRIICDNTDSNRVSSLRLPISVSGAGITSVDTSVSVAFAGLALESFSMLRVTKCGSPDPSIPPFDLLFEATDTLGGLSGDTIVLRIVVTLSDIDSVRVDTSSACGTSPILTTQSGFSYVPGWASVECPVDTTTPMDFRCSLDWNWHVGPAIKVTQELDWWPKGDLLKEMRPGDVIAISIYAEDRDYLVQTCSCDDDELLTRKIMGTYADIVKCRWQLGLGQPGSLIQVDAPVDNNTVLYQIPTCGWTEDGVTQSATISLEILNNIPGALKAIDPPLVGYSITFNMTLICKPKPGWINVSAEFTVGPPNTDASVEESSDSFCKPRVPPHWIFYVPLSGPSISIKEPPDNLCPKYLTLVHAKASDSDEFVLKCKDDLQVCKSREMSEKTADPILFSWSKNQPGKGEFPVGTKGAVVAFRRSRSAEVDITCAITESHTQIDDDDDGATAAVSVWMSYGPEAVVLQGNKEGWKVAKDVEDAAKTAEEKYRAAGYITRTLPPPAKATLNDIKEFLKSPCVQALWICGHGASGAIHMYGDPVEFNNGKLLDYSQASWSCAQNPYLRELVLLGCNTADRVMWPRRVVCASIKMFGENLYPGGFPRGWYGTNPAVWEKSDHKPPPPHNLSTP